MADLPALRQAADAPDAPAADVRRLGRALQMRGDLPAALEVLARLEGLLGDDACELAAVRHDKGLLLRHQGDLAGARAALEAALEVREHELGADATETAATQSMLAVVLQESGESEAAEAMHLRSLAVVERQVAALHSPHEQLLDELAHVEPALHHVEPPAAPAAGAAALSVAVADDEEQEQEQDGGGTEHNVDTPRSGTAGEGDVFGRPGVRAITDTAGLMERVRQLHLRLMHGFPEAHAEVSRLARDVDMMPAGELRELATTMCSMLGDMKSLHACQQAQEPQTIRLPMLDGYLFKKSQSMFKGRVRRYFRVDPRAGELCYFKDKGRFKNGNAPRGRLPLMDIVDVHRSQASGNRARFQFEITVMIAGGGGSTAGFSLQAESVEDRDRWIVTLNAYRDAYAAAVER